MLNILDEVHRKISYINSVYEYPVDPNFHLLKIPVIEWPSAKDGNFFNIIRVLAIRGPVSLSFLVNLHVDGDHPYNSTYHIIHRLLNGSKSKSHISLQERGLVSKEGRLYGLTPIGVLYAIHVFHMDKYYDKKHNKLTETDDFSYQKDIDGIFDIIKKHYSYFPLFFENLDHIKESKYIDINIFFKILNPNDTIVGSIFYNFHTFSEKCFDPELEKMIPFIFYYSASISHFLHTKEPFYIEKNIAHDLFKISNDMLKKMKKDLTLYENVNSAMFS